MDSDTEIHPSLHARNGQLIAALAHKSQVDDEGEPIRPVGCADQVRRFAGHHLDIDVSPALIELPADSFLPT